MHCVGFKILSSSGPDHVQVHSKCSPGHLKLDLHLRFKRSGHGSNSIIATYHQWKFYKDSIEEDIWWINYWVDWQRSTHPTQITFLKTSLISFKSDEMDGWTNRLSIKYLHLSQPLVKIQLFCRKWVKVLKISHFVRIFTEQS